MTEDPGAARWRDQSPAVVTDGNLRSLTRGVVTLLEVSAPWCPACLTLGPLCDVLERQHAGLVRIARCDIDANRGVAAALRVRSVTLVVVFAADGSEVGRVGGVFARRSLVRTVTEALGRPGPDVGTGPGR